MARISPKVMRKAKGPLKLLMPANNGVLEDAKMEYKWIQEHHGIHNKAVVKKCCLERSRFVPLQYILSISRLQNSCESECEGRLTKIETQPFGLLEIECKRGVLIPRWETEEWSTQLAEEINRYSKLGRTTKPMKVLDLCSGSGCIALNIASLLQSKDIDILGLDISNRAVDLANANLKRNIDLVSDGVQVAFQKMDVLAPEAERHILAADVIAMNPPYILQEEEHHISLSARRYEPRSALVPSESSGAGELFYRSVLTVLKNNPHSAKLLAFEIGSASQSERVRNMIIDHLGWTVEIKQDSAARDRSIFATAPV